MTARVKVLGLKVGETRTIPVDDEVLALLADGKLDPAPRGR